MSQQAIQFPDELTVSVTAEHIASGAKKHCSACPVALALNEKYAPLKAIVSPESLDLVDSGEEPLDVVTSSDRYVCYHTPIEATVFIAAFDSGKAVEPFTFTSRRIS